MTDRATHQVQDDDKMLRMILTGRQYEMWEFKKNFAKNYYRPPKQSEIAVFMRISQGSVSKMNARIVEKLSI